MSPLHPLLRHTTKQQGAKLGYLESSFLRGSQRLPFWRVQELVWKDVVKELSVLAHSDPAERTHLGHKGDVTRTSSTHTTCRQPAPPGRKTSPYLMCVSYPLQDSCRCSHLRGCCSFLYGKGYLLPLPHIPSAFHFLVQSQPSWVQCLVLNQPFSPCKTAAAFQALISQLFVLASSSCPQGCTKTFPDLMLGKLLHPEPPKITSAIIPDTSRCQLTVRCTLPFNLSRSPKYPFPLFLLQLPTNVKVKPAPRKQRIAVQAWGSGRAFWSSILSSSPPDLRPLSFLSPCSPVVQCAKTTQQEQFRSYKAQFTAGFQSAGGAAWKGQGSRGTFLDPGTFCISKSSLSCYRPV